MCCFCFSLGIVVFVLFAFDLVSSVPHQEIGWDEVSEMTYVLLSGT